MSSRSISYKTRSDATPEAELSALASVYRFVLDRRRDREKPPIVAASRKPARRPRDAK